MKRTSSIYLLICMMVTFTNASEQKKFVIVTASYNNQSWYKKNLESLFCQNYNNWHLIYTDDASPDGTGKAVEQFIAQSGKQDKVTLIKNTERKGALENIYNAVCRCEPKDVIVLLDGDDWFVGGDVLSYLNQVYTNDNDDVWLTYGQFVEWPSGKHGFCCDMPEDVMRNGSFRQSGILPSHLRTFYAGLFQKIDKKDLVDAQGHFFMMAWDVALMIPMVEMSCGHFRFIDKVLYEYNGTNPLSDHKLSRWLQLHIDGVIRKKPAYAKLDTLFE